MSLFSFDEAVERARKEKRAAFAFCPITAAPTPAGEDAAPVGANLFVLAHGTGEQCCVHYVGGFYGTRRLVRERYMPEQAPQEARRAAYLLLEWFDEVLLEGELQSIHTALQMLAGAR